MLELKVRKFGNSLGVIVPKEMLEEMGGLKEGDTIQALKGERKEFRLQAEDAMFAKQMKVARDIMKRYHNTLKELAK